MNKSGGDAMPVGFVAGGGWLERHCFSKPRARLFTTLSLLWITPSLGALFILLYNRPVAVGETLGERLLSIRVESWISLSVLFAQLMFLFLAAQFALSETPQETVERQPAPTDLHNLYLKSGKSNAHPASDSNLDAPKNG
jgi:hypothetical protein